MNEEVRRRAYAAVGDNVMRHTVEYYRSHIAACMNIWPRERGRHERWLKEQFGDETAGKIMFQVKDWNRNEW